MKRLSEKNLQEVRQQLRLLETFGKLEGTKTAENLQKAFEDGAADHVKYLCAAKMASAEGYPEISALFEEAALEELEHATKNLTHLSGVLIGLTARNIQNAVEGETEANKTDYPEMARAAQDEGFADIAEWFEVIAKTRGKHAQWFRDAQRTLGKD